MHVSIAIAIATIATRKRYMYLHGLLNLNQLAISIAIRDPCDHVSQVSLLATCEIALS